MHTIEPFYNWRHLYSVETDPNLPFFEKTYSEFYFTETVYNYLIHPQWDNFGSDTLYLKILFVNYKKHFCIIELMGEWNDALYNDFMTLKHATLELLMQEKVIYFIFIGENIFNFHYRKKTYYKEWNDELKDLQGWAIMINLHTIAQYDFKKYKIDKYIPLIQFDEWRIHTPEYILFFCKKSMSGLLQ